MKTISGWWTSLVTHEKMFIIMSIVMGSCIVAVCASSGALISLVCFILSVGILVVAICGVISFIVDVIGRKS